MPRYGHLLPLAALPYLVTLPLLAGLPGRVQLLAIVLALLGGWISVVDRRRLIIPDAANLMLAAAGVAATLFVNPQRLGLHLLAAAVGWALLRLVDMAHQRWRGRVGLGQGDAKLFAAAGLWVGPDGLPGVLLWAALLGIAGAAWQAASDRRRRRWRSRPQAFGPCLAFGLWLVWILGPPRLG